MIQGLDLVRREWCVLSKDTGKFVLDRVLSGESRETVVASIHENLEALAKRMRAGEVPTPQYVITKGLNKAPHEYPDAKSQPHVQVGALFLFHVACFDGGGGGQRGDFHVACFFCFFFGRGGAGLMCCALLLVGYIFAVVYFFYVLAV